MCVVCVCGVYVCACVEGVASPLIMVSKNLRKWCIAYIHTCPHRHLRSKIMHTSL